MKGKIESIAINGRSMEVYVTAPQSGKGPGVMVLQEWWGLNENVTSICDRFADAGFIALAPDLYHGRSATAPDEAGRLMMALNIEDTAEDLVRAAEYLLSQKACTSKEIGVIGFCMGGQLALYAGSLSEKVGAIADFYGIHPNVKPDYSKIKAPVLGIFAEKDEFVNPQVVRKLESDLKQAGVPTDFEIFKNVHHAFFNESRPEVFNKEAAEQAWQKTLKHFHQHLE